MKSISKNIKKLNSNSQFGFSFSNIFRISIFYFFINKLNNKMHAIFIQITKGLKPSYEEYQSFLSLAIKLKIIFSILSLAIKLKIIFSKYNPNLNLINL